MNSEVEAGKRLAELIAKRPTWRSGLSEAVRRDAMAYTLRRVSQGVSLRSIARELEVSSTTVRRWVSPKVVPPAKAPQAKPITLRRVCVEEEESERGQLVVLTHNGLRIEGLTLPDLITLLRAVIA